MSSQCWLGLNSKMSLKFQLQLTRRPWTWSPASLPHFVEKGPLRKDVGPTCRATVGMRIKAATFQTYKKQKYFRSTFAFECRVIVQSVLKWLVNSTVLHVKLTNFPHLQIQRSDILLRLPVLLKKITEIAWKVSKTKGNKRLFEAAW